MDGEYAELMEMDENFDTDGYFDTFASNDGVNEMNVGPRCYEQNFSRYVVMEHTPVLGNLMRSIREFEAESSVRADHHIPQSISPNLDKEVHFLVKKKGRLSGNPESCPSPRKFLDSYDQQTNDVVSIYPLWTYKIRIGNSTIAECDFRRSFYVEINLGADQAKRLVRISIRKYQGLKDEVEEEVELNENGRALLRYPVPTEKTNYKKMHPEETLMSTQLPHSQDQDKNWNLFYIDVKTDNNAHYYSLLFLSTCGRTKNDKKLESSRRVEALKFELQKEEKQIAKHECTRKSLLLRIEQLESEM